jgi:hypothetical protein
VFGFDRGQTMAGEKERETSTRGITWASSYGLPCGILKVEHKPRNHNVISTGRGCECTTRTRFCSKYGSNQVHIRQLEVDKIMRFITRAWRSDSGSTSVTSRTRFLKDHDHEHRQVSIVTLTTTSSFFSAYTSLSIVFTNCVSSWPHAPNLQHIA